jgi:N-methylhydantoinase B/oxoprolinase/acetone carboxylase alpha subunit
MRTAYNQVIYEAEDFTVGLFDANGNTIRLVGIADVHPRAVGRD